jgi:hypothetical protein
VVFARTAWDGVNLTALQRRDLVDIIQTDIILIMQLRNEMEYVPVGLEARKRLTKNKRGFL